MKTYDELLKETFSLCKDKSVLELSTFRNLHSNIIKTFAHSWQGVEPDQRFAGPNTFTGTANDFYRSNIGEQEYDIVICFGLLYHLHSPIHLFEQIINKSKPKTIIIESVNTVGITYHEEEFNTSGNAFCDEDITIPMPWNITCTADITTKILDSVGYKYVGGMVNYNNLEIEKEYGKSKKDCWLGIYEKS
tara:strand:+ start:199 stop:771 length:573 start_codon:yes stop_codon:yes gene_type:complete